MWVDRSFTIGGAGTVVTGTLLDGPVAVGDTLAVWPEARPARVRSVQSHERIAGTGRARRPGGPEPGGSGAGRGPPGGHAGAGRTSGAPPPGSSPTCGPSATSTNRCAIGGPSTSTSAAAPSPPASACWSSRSSTGPGAAAHHGGRTAHPQDGRPPDPPRGGPAGRGRRRLRARPQPSPGRPGTPRRRYRCCGRPRPSPDDRAGALLAVRGMDDLAHLAADTGGGRPAGAMAIGSLALDSSGVPRLAALALAATLEYHEANPLRPGMPKSSLAERLGRRAAGAGRRDCGRRPAVRRRGGGAHRRRSREASTPTPRQAWEAVRAELLAAGLRRARAAANWASTTR